MDSSLKYVSGKFSGNFYTHQKSPLSAGEKIPTGALHDVHLFQGELTDTVSIESFDPREHLNRDGMLLHNITNIQIHQKSVDSNDKKIYDFDQFVLKNVKVESSWEQNGKTYGVLNGELVGKVKKTSKYAVNDDNNQIIPPPPPNGGNSINPIPIDGGNKGWDQYIPPLIKDNNGGCFSSIWNILKWILLFLLIMFLFKQCESCGSNSNKLFYCETRVDSLSEENYRLKKINDSLFNIILYKDSVCNSNIERERLQCEIDNISSKIYFNGGTVDIREYSDDEINKIVDILDKNPNVFIEIQGYYNGSGSPNISDLDLKRANRVKELIVNKGVSIDRITTIGLGNTKPIVDENQFYTDPFGNKYNANMRVEIKIVKY
jgi:outer membrane protein OmpA-like peptidoglycan-associated protein